MRITTRWEESYFASGLYGAMHECGHGLYEAGIADSLQRTPLGPWRVARAARVPEPDVGEHGGPRPAVLRSARAADRASVRTTRRRPGPDRCTGRSTGSQPSFIRVEADEATYGLHIVLRFELEQELIEGRLAVADLPEAWNARFEDYLGLEVPDDAQGVLQDVHWSAG